MLTVQSSCACTTPEITSREIQPGERGEIRAIVRGTPWRTTTATLSVFTDCAAQSRIDVVVILPPNAKAPYLAVSGPQDFGIVRTMLGSPVRLVARLEAVECCDAPQRWIRSILWPCGQKSSAVPVAVSVSGDKRTCRVTYECELDHDPTEHGEFLWSRDCLDAAGKAVARAPFGVRFADEVELVPSQIRVIVGPGDLPVVRRMIIVNTRSGVDAACRIERQSDLPSWLAAVPAKGGAKTARRDGSSAFDLTINVASLPPGDYVANLCLRQLEGKRELRLPIAVRKGL